ncbi:MAG: hypothetical protein HQ559_10265 [Lentisphaerae bacterium]|nr:hypothetical protein [Lentisphaerota bacterium]
MLTEIIETPDGSMTWWHFKQILGPFLPAGTYEEAAYFLPLAFDYILSHDDDSLELVTSLAWFISEYRDQLEAVSALAACRDWMTLCLRTWTKDFTVIHSDRGACEKKQWGIRCFDYVKHSETIAEGTCDLVRFTANADLAIEVYRRVSATTADPVEAAWFLEFARQRCVHDVRKPPKCSEVTELLEDKETVERSAQTVSAHLPSYPKSPSYWRATFNALGVESVKPPRWAE